MSEQLVLGAIGGVARVDRVGGEGGVDLLLLKSVETDLFGLFEVDPLLL